MSKVCSEPECERPVCARGLCSRHYQRMRREDPDHAARLRERGRKYYAENPDYASRKRASQRRLAGMPAIGERREGPCEICHEHTAPLQLDHCHKTGQLRGWLCMRCNTALGMLGDDWRRMTRAARYVIAAEQRASGRLWPLGPVLVDSQCGTLTLERNAL